ncbi:MAG TPA: 3-deoxy-7-phosphoheptulonate synthase class II [Gammaproteobacteria bacterium]|nr:3-deoxy-7-phosphoheptulonate synthase class II [Gammaproteobacteria bacterium]HVC28423.1 3-deoxy-7-phosphoheptulonate synthase class II [Gammaproteobacteria bacterium]
MDDKFTQDWQPQTWQSRTADQQPLYSDAQAVERVLAEIHRRPPLVTWGEVDKLRSQLAEAGRGERFVLQGGDCAESFDDCTSEPIGNKLKILLQMSLVLVHGLKKRVIRVGRMAGQYAKPRSAEHETRNGVTLPSYRGDIINRSGFSAVERTANPNLMLSGYEHAALTLNYLRALVDGGFADLHHPEYWDLDFVRDSPLEAEYRRIVQSILNSLNFIEAISSPPLSESKRIDFFTSHEGLHLLYEQAQTNFVSENGRWYNLATHFPWIGMRTADVNSAHVEYFRGIANPIAVKVGPGMSPEQLLELCAILNPHNELGRLTLIHRFGAALINDKLSDLLEAVRQKNLQVLWICDPMHGNTETTASGIKTRRFENILAELEAAFALHEQHGSVLGGVHFEFTGDDVTECTGGISGLTDTDLERAYKSQVDPRLNYEQALEMAMRIVARKTSKRLSVI